MNKEKETVHALANVELNKKITERAQLIRIAEKIIQGSIAEIIKLEASKLVDEMIAQQENT